MGHGQIVKSERTGSAVIDAPLMAILPAYGGKRTLAPTIVEEFGPHKSYWEPFCLSAAVIFAKVQSAYETINDLNGDVTNLLRVLASDQWEMLCDRVERTAFCEDLHRDAVAALATVEDEFDRAYFTLVAAWMGRNGTYGLAGSSGGNFCIRFTHNGGNSGVRWQSVARSIPAWHKRLLGVAVLRRDALKIIPKIGDAPGTVIYADPPYLDKSHEYVCDMTEDQHRELADMLSAKKHTRVVVSYYEHPLLAELYPADKWTKRPLAAKKGLTIPSGEAATAPEVLLINGPSLAGGGK